MAKKKIRKTAKPAPKQKRAAPAPKPVAAKPARPAPPAPRPEPAIDPSLSPLQAALARRRAALHGQP